MTRPGLPAKLTNLIRNPSFEQGNANFPDFTAVAVADAVDGAYVGQWGPNAGTLQSHDYIPIDVMQAYQISGWLRWVSGATQPHHYLGVAPFDASFRPIGPQNVYAIPGTETTLAADVNPTDTTITLTDGTAWRTGITTAETVAFNIIPGGADLPNWNITSRQIQSVSGNVLTMNGQVGVSWPAGTRVRMHSYGGSFLYTAAANVLTPTVFTQYTGIISGQQKPYDSPGSNAWWIGTKYARVLLLLGRDVNGLGVGATTQVDALDFHSISPAAVLDQGEFVHLIELSFSGGPVRLNTGAVDLFWGGFVWEAVGGALNIGSGVQETTDAKGQGVDLKLAGVDQSLVSTLLNNSYRGREAIIYRAYLDPATGKVLDNPTLLFRGLQRDAYTVEEQRDRTGGTVTISTRLSGYFGVDRTRGIQTNLASHQHEYPGDTFFQFVAPLQNQKIYWATQPLRVAKPRNGGTAKPTSGGHGYTEGGVH